jgi:hypothetical protein
MLHLLQSMFLPTSPALANARRRKSLHASCPSSSARSNSKWAGTVLRIEDFASILEPELLVGLLWKRTAMQTEVERIAGLEPSGMEGQVRGEDYQYCPTCKAPIALEDGCNHVACDCGENFCFFCGKVAEEHSGHWEAPDGCGPRVPTVRQRSFATACPISSLATSGGKRSQLHNMEE